MQNKADRVKNKDILSGPAAGVRLALLGIAALLGLALATGCNSRQTSSVSAAPGVASTHPAGQDSKAALRAQSQLQADQSVDDMEGRLQATTYPPNGSANFHSETGRYEVFFPADPKRSVRDQRNIVGEFYSVQHQGAHYFAGYFVHPYRGLDKLILKKSINRVVDKVGGGNLDAQEISFKGKVGREFLIQGGTDGVMVHGRYYCFGNRVFLTRYSAPISQFQEDEALYFLDSFNPFPAMQTAAREE